MILSAMKTHSSNATVQEHGCAALDNLAVNNDNNKVTIAEEEAIPMILSAMKTHSSYQMNEQNADIYKESRSALWELACNHDNS